MLKARATLKTVPGMWLTVVQRTIDVKGSIHNKKLSVPLVPNESESHMFLFVSE